MTDLRKLTNATLRHMIVEAGGEDPGEEPTKKELIALYTSLPPSYPAVADIDAAIITGTRSETFVMDMPDVVTCRGCGRELLEVSRGGDWMAVVRKELPPAVLSDPVVLIGASYCSGCAHAAIEGHDELEIRTVEA